MIVYFVTIVLGLISIMSFNDGAYFVSVLTTLFLITILFLVIRDVGFCGSIIKEAVKEFK